MIVFKVIERRLVDRDFSPAYVGERKGVEVVLISEPAEQKRFGNNIIDAATFNVVVPADEYDNYPIGAKFKLQAL